VLKCIPHTGLLKLDVPLDKRCVGFVLQGCGDEGWRVEFEHHEVDCNFADGFGGISGGSKWMVGEEEAYNG
jgi:hypothetical protein